MRKTLIDRVAIDSSGRLRVRPKLPPGEDFAFIWRDASGVRWDSEERCLVAPPPKQWSYFDWFKQVLAAVSNEYGQLLQLVGDTEWVYVPPEIRRAIEEWWAEQADEQ